MSPLTFFAGFPCERSFFIENYVLCAIILAFGIMLAFVAYRRIRNKKLKLLVAAVIVVTALIGSLVWWDLAVPYHCEQPLIDNFRYPRSGYR